MTLEEKFWANVQKSDGCWEWIGAKSNGYGAMRIPAAEGGGMIKAPRYSAMLHFGMFDKRAHICHHCDNPGCVNPEHLYVGSNTENAADRARRGRSRNQWTGKDQCKRGHSLSETVNRRQGCAICEKARGREQRKAISAAARALNLPQAKYIAQYGASRATAEAVISMAVQHPECALLAVQKFVRGLS